MGRKKKLGFVLLVVLFVTTGAGCGEDVDTSAPNYVIGKVGREKFGPIVTSLFREGFDDEVEVILSDYRWSCEDWYYNTEGGYDPVPVEGDSVVANSLEFTVGTWTYFHDYGYLFDWESEGYGLEAPVVTGSYTIGDGIGPGLGAQAEASSSSSDGDHRWAYVDSGTIMVGEYTQTETISGTFYLTTDEDETIEGKYEAKYCPPVW